MRKGFRGAVYHGRAVWDDRRWLTPGCLQVHEVAAFVDGGGKLEIELVARAILLGCQSLSGRGWRWFTEGALRRWFQRTKLPWEWLRYAFECGMIVAVRRKRQPTIRLFAVTKRFVRYWSDHLKKDHKERGR